MDRTELTPAQKNVLDSLKSYRQEHGYMPSIREIGQIFGIKSPNGVKSHLDALERKGKIKRHKGGARAILIVGENGDGNKAKAMDIIRAVRDNCRSIGDGLKLSEALKLLGE